MPIKSPVVTGAGRGIGRAIALKFANEGAGVVVVSRTQENSEKVAAEIRALGKKAWAFAVDVADSAAVGAAGEKILADCGKVDILVNNAGVTRDGLLMRMSDADWDTVLDTNLKGAFLFYEKAFSRVFAKRSVRVASSNISLGHRPHRQSGAEQLRGEQGGAVPGSRSRSRASSRVARHHCQLHRAGFHPETDMTSGVERGIGTRLAILKQIPMGKFGAAEDIANAALFLASASARYITGQVLTVDGGMVM